MPILNPSKPVVVNCTLALELANNGYKTETDYCYFKHANGTWHGPCLTRHAMMVTGTEFVYAPDAEQLAKEIPCSWGIEHRRKAPIFDWETGGKINELPESTLADTLGMIYLRFVRSSPGPAPVGVRIVAKQQKI